jgi:hypothetical protein
MLEVTVRFVLYSWQILANDGGFLKAKETAIKMCWQHMTKLLTESQGYQKSKQDTHQQINW